MKTSKLTLTDAARQTNSKPVLTPSLRAVPVELESLRQQIAAKENELKLRKRKGSKELSNVGIASTSSWLADTSGTLDPRMISAEKSENEAANTAVYLENAPGVLRFQASEVFKGSNASSAILSQEMHSEQIYASHDVDSALAVPREMVPPETVCMVARSGALAKGNDAEPISNEIAKPASEENDPTKLGARISETIGNQAHISLKRGGHECELGSDMVKRIRTKEPVSMPLSNLVLNGSREGHKSAHFDSADTSLNGKSAVVNMSEGVEFSQSKYQFLPVQEIQTMTATDPLENTETGTVKKRSHPQIRNASHGIDSAAFQVTEGEIVADNDNHVFRTARFDCCTELPHKVIEGALQLDDPVEEDILKHVNTRIHTNASLQSTPVNVVVKQHGEGSLSARDQNIIQGALIGTNSSCSSLPMWDYNNTNVSFIPNADQRLEYENDSLWKLQEDEDAIDRELEEARKDRHRCEIQEHFARRQYRDAQEALHTANLRCQLLLQRREMLSASIKAAQFRMASNGLSGVSHQTEGTLISLGVSNELGKDTFSFRTSIWARERDKDKNASLELMSNQHDFSSASEQAKAHTSFLEAKYQNVNEKGNESVVIADPSARKTREDHVENLNVYVRDENFDALQSRHSSPPKVLLGSQVKGSGLCSGDVVTESGSQSEMGEENCQASSENRLHSTVPAGMIPKTTGRSSLGFSSASFATDLGEVGNQDSNMREKVRRLKGQEVNSREQELPARHLHASCAQANLNEGLALKRTVNGASSSPSKGHTTSRNEPYSLILGSCEHELGPKSEAQLKIISTSEEFKQLNEEGAASGDESIIRNKDQELTKLTVTDSFTNREKVCSLKVLVSSDLKSPKTVYDERVQLNERTKGCGEDFSYRRICKLDSMRPQLSESQELPVVDPGKEVGNARTYSKTDLCMVSLVENTPMNSNKVNASESSRPVCLITSVSLQLLFRNMPNSEFSNVWKMLIQSGKGDQMVHVPSENYESPLSVFHSYSGIVHCEHPHSGRSGSQVYRFNPHKILCMFEHRGKCNDDKCPWQHKRDYILPKCDGVHCCTEVSALQIVPRDDFSPSESKQGDLNEIQETTGTTFLQPCWTLNVQCLEVPLYRMGPHATRMQGVEVFPLFLISKGRFNSRVPFLAHRRQTPMDVPYLFDSSLKQPLTNDFSLISNELCVEDRPWIQDKVHQSGVSKDTESLLEAALELIDYDIEVQKLELRKQVLYVLSRGLEVNPCSVPLWVVYLKLFCRWQHDSNNDDLFLSAVQHNNGSYELWMMFINTRRHIKDRLEAYESAIVTLGRSGDPQYHALGNKSCLLLDLSLQKLNFLCMADMKQEAVIWINNLSRLASEDSQDYDRDDASSAWTILTCLTRSDLCVLWICCAFVILRSRLPDIVAERLGYKQQLFFHDIWPDSEKPLGSASEVMRLMQTAASHGTGCMKLDVNEFQEKEINEAKKAFIASYVQCAAVCEGLDCSFGIADKYFKNFSSSVELTLLRARLERHYRGESASLDTFEVAISCWPLDQSGKMRLWNQYIGFAFEAKGTKFLSCLMIRCANEIYNSDSYKSLYGKFDSHLSGLVDNVEKLDEHTPITSSEVSIFFQKACETLPVIVRRQMMKTAGFSGQQFSYQDAAYAFLNLAFFETLNKNQIAARYALQSSLNVAVDSDSMIHCLQEIAVFTFKGLDNLTGLSPSDHSNKVFEILDRCIIESRMLGGIYHLSKGFCDSIRRRRVGHFVDTLLCCSSSDCSVLNSVLESIHGPSLLPIETLAWTDVLDFAEKMLEVLPSNVKLAISICRVVQNKLPEVNAKSGSATLLWCSSLLIDSLSQSSPKAPLYRWLEAGGFLKMLDHDILLEEFYWLALSVYPFSSSIWHRLLEVSRRTGNFESALNISKDKGVKLELAVIS
ncbi:hypothetical protein KP509_22G060700 [Ceratopteris richardii]|nr:hypothetical protein KP509_22G060700 [Ceratopteris richardii]